MSFLQMARRLETYVLSEKILWEEVYFAVLRSLIQRRYYLKTGKMA